MKTIKEGMIISSGDSISILDENKKTRGKMANKN